MDFSLPRVCEIGWHNRRSVPTHFGLSEIDYDSDNLHELLMKHIHDASSKYIVEIPQKLKYSFNLCVETLLYIGTFRMRKSNEKLTNPT